MFARPPLGLFFFFVGHLRCGLNLAHCAAKIRCSIPRWRSSISDLPHRESRVAVPGFFRQSHSVCRQNSPMQGVFAPKVWVGAGRKLSAHKQRRAHDDRTSSLGKPILFVGKFLEFLKPFFQKGFKWVWAKPTTFTTFPHDLHTVSSRRRRQRPVWRRDWRLDSTMTRRASSLPTTMTRLWARVTAV